MPFLFLGISLFTFIAGYFRGCDIFSPWRIYVYSHSTILGVSLFYFHPAMTPIKPLTWFVILGGAISYIMGHVAFNLISPQLNFKNIKIEVPYVNWKFLLQVVMVYYFLYTLVYAYNSSIVGIPLFSSDIGDNRLKFFGVNYHTMLVLLLFPFFLMVSFSYRKFSKIAPIYNKILLALDLLLIISFVILLNRNSVMWLGFSLILVSHYCVRKIEGKKILFFIVLFFALIFVVGLSRTGHTYKVISKNKGIIEEILKTFYSYPANNVWNLDYNLNPAPDQFIHPRTYGFDHLSPVFDFVLISEYIRSKLGWEGLFIKKTAKVQGYNSVLYQWNLWKEFGPVLAMLIPFMSGFFICYIYKKMLEKRNLFMVWIYCQFAFFILFSFMVPFWYFNIAWFAILFSIFCYKFFPYQMNVSEVENI